MEEINKLSTALGFKVPLDGFLCAAFGKRVIDIILFDQKLESRFETYKDISMKDFITDNFGLEYFEIIDKYSS